MNEDRYDDDVMRVSIAEACGYKWFSCSANENQKILALSQEDADTVTLGQWVWHLAPPYPSCLNAMHEAEKLVLPDKDYNDEAAFQRFETYKHILQDVVWCETGMSDGFFIHASAREKAIAFCLTLDLKTK